MLVGVGVQGGVQALGGEGEAALFEGLEAAVDHPADLPLRALPLALAEAEGGGDPGGGPQLVEPLGDVDAEILVAQAEAEVRLLELRGAEDAEAEPEPVQQPVLAAEVPLGVRLDVLVEVRREHQAVPEEGEGVAPPDDDRHLVLRVARLHAEGVLEADRSAVGAEVLHDRQVERLESVGRGVELALDVLEVEAKRHGLGELLAPGRADRALLVLEGALGLEAGDVLGDRVEGGRDLLEAVGGELCEVDRPGAPGGGGVDVADKREGGVREEGGLHRHQLSALHQGEAGRVPVGGGGVVGDREEGAAHPQSPGARAVGHELTGLAAGGLYRINRNGARNEDQGAQSKSLKGLAKIPGIPDPACK